MAKALIKPSYAKHGKCINNTNLTAHKLVLYFWQFKLIFGILTAHDIIRIL